MKRIEIKKFFKLLEQGKKAYPQLQKFLEEVDRFILAIIQTVLTFLNSFLKGLKDQNDDEEKQVFETFEESFIHTSFCQKGLVLRVLQKIN